MAGDGTEVWDVIGRKPSKTFDEFVVAIVESYLLRERDA
jgi:hypothetical protein